MLLVVARLILSALRQHRLMRKQVTQTHLPAHPLDRHVTMVLYMQDGVIVDVERPLPPPALTLPSSWYTRHLAFLIEGGFAGEALQNLTRGVSLLGFSQTTNVQTASQVGPLTASQLLVRLDSGARNQYYTDYQWRVWAYSSCSGLAMAEVMNAYGHHFIAADVLQVELNLGVWSVYSGLLRDEGVSLTANHFGFNASLSHSRTLQNLIAISNKGAPVIVSVRDGYLRLVSCIQLFILESIASCSSLVPAATSEKPSVRLVIWRKLFPCWSLTIPPASSTILNEARNDSAVITSPLSI